jgi:hypothetical protein
VTFPSLGHHRGILANYNFLDIKIVSNKPGWSSAANWVRIRQASRHDFNCDRTGDQIVPEGALMVCKSLDERDREDKEFLKREPEGDTALY